MKKKWLLSSVFVSGILAFAPSVVMAKTSSGGENPISIKVTSSNSTWHRVYPASLLSKSNLSNALINTTTASPNSIIGPGGGGCGNNGANNTGWETFTDGASQLLLCSYDAGDHSMTTDYIFGTTDGETISKLAAYVEWDGNENTARSQGPFYPGGMTYSNNITESWSTSGTHSARVGIDAILSDSVVDITETVSPLHIS
ncbi:hypothetical protein [Alicyclobacillus acidoterrestris]|uniref:Secreted protein n=1 Tax=Alicyclobacillus acidoterrestris (strain ATCC 49025 / DSM 3922 / CIP 106132 / NCIMB 13137 / GD3B) TaxID=1356854 RepID=A0A9E7D056_ALIAG|nr:hypothetical protein [Alicyclobacillus acidoterrestris]UNO49417.1 hypothetical protein K1I37_02370 [Alicyclobacillus acidoterrestris]